MTSSRKVNKKLNTKHIIYVSYPEQLNTEQFNI